MSATAIKAPYEVDHSVTGYILQSEDGRYVLGSDDKLESVLIDTETDQSPCFFYYKTKEDAEEAHQYWPDVVIRKVVTGFYYSVD